MMRQLAEFLTQVVWRLFGDEAYSKGGWGCLVLAILSPALLLAGIIYLISLLF